MAGSSKYRLNIMGNNYKLQVFYMQGNDESIRSESASPKYSIRASEHSCYYVHVNMIFSLKSVLYSFPLPLDNDVTPLPLQLFPTLLSYLFFGYGV